MKNNTEQKANYEPSVGEADLEGMLSYRCLTTEDALVICLANSTCA